jgi:hypothetical protein
MMIWVTHTNRKLQTSSRPCLTFIAYGFLLPESHLALELSSLGTASSQKTARLEVIFRILLPLVQPEAETDGVHPITGLNCLW